MEWKHDDIKALRKKLSLSQREFAKKLGVSRNLIFYWESGKKKPSADSLRRLAELAKTVSKNEAVSKTVGQNEVSVSKNEVSVSKNEEAVSKTVGQNEVSVSKNEVSVSKNEEAVSKTVSKNEDTVSNSEEAVSKTVSKNEDTVSKTVSNFEDTVSNSEEAVSKTVSNFEDAVSNSEEAVSNSEENVTDPNGLAQAYYETMYSDARGVISLCTITQPKDSETDSSLRVSGFYEISRIPDLCAEAHKLNGRFHIYTGIHPLRERPLSGRGKEKDILGVAFFAADVDAKDFIEDKTERQKAIKDKAFYQWTDELLKECKALALAHIHQVCAKVEIPPTAIIDSGHGFYPIFKFDNFIEFSGSKHREELKQVNKAFHQAFAADSTFDFARILRVPLTRNIKPGYPADCELYEFHPDRRYTLDDIRKFETLKKETSSSFEFKDKEPQAEGVVHASHAKETEDTTKEEPTESQVREAIPRIGAKIDLSKFDLSKETIHWITTGKWAEGKKDKDGKPWTRSERDHSVVFRLVAAGATDDEIKAIFFLYPVGDKYREPGNGDRYLFLSIAKAREYQEKEKNAQGEKEKSPPIPIHLTDIEKSEYSGQEVKTSVLLPGVGRDDSFFVPKKVAVTCQADRARTSGLLKEDKSKCKNCPLIEDENLTYEFADSDRRLIRFTKMTDAQVWGEIRKAVGLPSGCKEYKSNTVATAEVQILLAVPKAGAELRKEGSQFVDEHGRDFREKVIYYGGVVPRSNAYYQAQGTVIADPKSQRATMLATELQKLQNEYEQFRITDDTKELLRAFQAVDDNMDSIDAKMRELGKDIAYNIAHYYGEPRILIVIADMLAWHSVRQFPFDDDMMTKGWIDLLIFGDSGINKTTHLRKLRSAIDFGYFVDGGAVSRAGLLYSLDDVHSGIRILRWGSLPLNDGQLVIIDEAQNITMDVWQEMSSARTTGLLTVTKAKHGEHPMRTRQIYTANPKPPNTMASYSFPIRGIKGLMRPADMRRFDIAICAARGEVAIDEVNRRQAERDDTGNVITPEHLKASIARAWTRRPEHVVWVDDAEAAVMEIATKLQKKLGCGDIPVIDIDAKDKVARGAVALAALLVSTDETFEKVIVKPCHALWIGLYFMTIYSAQAAMLDKHARVAGKAEGISDIEVNTILQEWQKLNPPEPEHLAEMAILIAEGEGIERDVLAAQVGVTPRQISTLIQKFKQHRFVKSTRKGYFATPRLIQFYREMHEKLSNLASY